MKRGLTLTQALFLLILYCKATNTPTFGHVPGWVAVFSPFFGELLVLGIAELLERTGAGRKVLFFAWKKVMHYRVKRAYSKATKNAINEVRRQNPGQFQDPANYGK